jgi:hypothetical protein
MADGGATFYLAMAAVAAGTAVTTMDTINANKERQRILEQELRSNELAALDEENRRLLALREANDDILVNAGGIDAWASLSLIAARKFNFKTGMEDIENIRFNVAGMRAGISARIGILKANSKATLTSGILSIAATGLSAASKASALSKTKAVPTGGAGGINATHGVGILDTPGMTPGTILG